MYGGVKPVLHGRTCSIMKELYFKSSTGVVFKEYSDYAAENANAYFPTNRYSGLIINEYGVDPLRYIKLIKLCELCSAEYPDIASQWKAYFVNKLQQDTKGMTKVGLENRYGQSIANEIVSYLKTPIPENEEAKALEELKEKADISQKYGYEWCSNEIKDNCMIEGRDFEVIEQKSDGTLVKTTRALLATYVVAITTGIPILFDDDEFFITANSQDSKVDVHENIKNGIFAHIGTYRYLTSSGTKTVKKLKRLQ